MNHDTHDQVKRAEAEIIGTKLCFNCGKYRPADGFKFRMIGNRKFWKCGLCTAKANPSGLK